MNKLEFEEIVVEEAPDIGVDNTRGTQRESLLIKESASK
jgi:hypothetical protein